MLGDEPPLRRILVASALPFEGKSTVTFNLGLAFGEVGKRVIIADATSIVRHFIDSPTARHARDSRTCWRVPAISGKTIMPITENVHLAPRGGSMTAPARSGLGNRLTQILSGTCQTMPTTSSWTRLRSC